MRSPDAEHSKLFYGYSLLRRHIAEKKLIAERAKVDYCEANSTRKK
jgi:hypothetical protein